MLLRQRTLMDQIMAGALGGGGTGGPGASSSSQVAASGSQGGGAGSGGVSVREAELLAGMLSALLRCCDNVMRTRLGRRLKLRCVGGSVGRHGGGRRLTFRCGEVWARVKIRCGCVLRGRV